MARRLILCAVPSFLGLFSLQFARLSGAIPAIVSDVRADRRYLALQLGANAVLDPVDPAYEARVQELTHSRGVNTMIEVTGNPAAMNSSLHLMARFGRIALPGCMRTEVAVDFYHDVGADQLGGRYQSSKAPVPARTMASRPVKSVLFPPAAKTWKPL